MIYLNLSGSKKILIVVESINVDESSGAKGRVALINNLHKAGYELLVYHYTKKNIHLEGIKCISIPENRKSLLFFLSRLERQLRNKLNVDIHKQLEKTFGFSFTHYNDRNSIIHSLQAIENFEPSLVLTLSQGGRFRPHHALLKIPKWHYKWMAYIHDPYPMHSYPRPYDWVEPGYDKKRQFFMKVAEKAKYAAYPSKLLAEWMESYFPALKGKSVVIPHQISSLKNRNLNLPSYFSKDHFSIIHAGALMNARNPMFLVTAFRQFLKEFPEAKENSRLIFIGAESKYSKEFLHLAKDLPQLISSDKYLPFPVVSELQQAASVNVILEAKGPISPFLPGKFPHCIEAGKPILLLGPYYSESRRLLGEDYPWWSEIDDEDRIFTHLVGLYQDWQNGARPERDYDQLRYYLSEKKLKEILEKLEL